MTTAIVYRISVVLFLVGVHSHPRVVPPKGPSQARRARNSELLTRQITDAALMRLRIHPELDVGKCGIEQAHQVVEG